MFAKSFSSNVNQFFFIRHSLCTSWHILDIFSIFRDKEFFFQVTNSIPTMLLRHRVYNIKRIQNWPCYFTIFSYFNKSEMKLSGKKYDNNIKCVYWVAYCWSMEYKTVSFKGSKISTKCEISLHFLFDEVIVFTRHIIVYPYALLVDKLNIHIKVLS